MDKKDYRKYKKLIKKIGKKGHYDGITQVMSAMSPEERKLLLEKLQYKRNKTQNNRFNKLCIKINNKTSISVDDLCMIGFLGFGVITACQMRVDHYRGNNNGKEGQFIDGDVCVELDLLLDKLLCNEEFVEGLKMVSSATYAVCLAILGVVGLSIYGYKVDSKLDNYDSVIDDLKTKIAIDEKCLGSGKTDNSQTLYNGRMPESITFSKSLDNN